MISKRAFKIPSTLIVPSQIEKKNKVFMRPIICNPNPTLKDGNKHGLEVYLVYV